MPALGKLIVETSTRVQTIVVSRSAPLIEMINEESGESATMVGLVRDDEGTKIEHQVAVEEPAWHFPERYQ